MTVGLPFVVALFFDAAAAPPLLFDIDADVDVDAVDVEARGGTGGFANSGFAYMTVQSRALRSCVFLSRR